MLLESLNIPLIHYLYVSPTATSVALLAQGLFSGPEIHKLWDKIPQGFAFSHLMSISHEHHS